MWTRIGAIFVIFAAAQILIASIWNTKAASVRVSPRPKRFIADRGISANYHALLFFTGYRTGIRLNKLYYNLFGQTDKESRAKVESEIKAIEKNITLVQDMLTNYTLVIKEETLDLQRNVSLIREKHKEQIMEVLGLEPEQSEVVLIEEDCLEDMDAIDWNDEDPLCDIMAIVLW